MEQYPLPHNGASSFGLGATSQTKYATVIPLIRSTEEAVNAEGTIVNPRHNTFQEDAGVTCNVGSIVPMLGFKLNAFIPETPIDLGVKHMVFKFMPIYLAFEDNYRAIDSLSSTEVEDILQMTHATTDKAASPAYSTKLFSPGNLPLSDVADATEAFGDWGLTTNAQYEGVPFVEDDMYDTLQYKTNAGMLRKSIGQVRTGFVTDRKTFTFYSNKFTNPIVKRMNEYTFCGVIVWVPPADTPEQPYLDSDLTDIEHIHFNYRFRFSEWNPNFDQTAL